MRIAICKRSPGGWRINTRLDNPIWSGIKMNIYTASKIPSRGENLGSPEFFALSLSLSWSHSKAHTHLLQQRESKFGKWCSKQACAITIDSLLCLPGVCALAQWPRRHTHYTYKARRRRQYTHTMQRTANLKGYRLACLKFNTIRRYDCEPDRYTPARNEFPHRSG